jgi:hypothetical protein
VFEVSDTQLRKNRNSESELKPESVGWNEDKRGDTSRLDGQFGAGERMKEVENQKGRHSEGREFAPLS